jgi:putative DNA methylase
MAVVAAYPVHAELRAASPKTAAKDPISLDAILVCKKFSEFQSTSLDTKLVIQQSEGITIRLQNAGMSITQADRFVILASQLLIPLSKQKCDFNTACNLLQQTHQAAQQIVPADLLKRSAELNRYPAEQSSAFLVG